VWPVVALHIGTCGFSYRDWVGPFYPAGIKSLEMLPYYAQRFGCVEIDSTYYAIPRPQLFESMDRRTPVHFRFTVKAPGSITHLPASESPSGDEAGAFRACLEPIQASGKLGAVLAQFPHAFRPGPDALRRLRWLREQWPDIDLIAEFRHRLWQGDETLAALRDLRIGWCNVDEPGFSSLMRPGSEVTSSIGYIRFHGRNYGRWWAKERAAHERYVGREPEQASALNDPPQSTKGQKTGRERGGKRQDHRGREFGKRGRVELEDHAAHVE